MKKINAIVVSMLFVCTSVFLTGCDDDDPAPTILDITTLNGSWVDDNVPLAGEEEGFVVVEFLITDTSADGEVYAATLNDANIVCPDPLFRNLVAAEGNSFVGEGLLSSGGSYEDVTLTLIDDNTINVSWDCSSCTPVVDVLSKTTSLSDVLPIVVNSDIDEETTFYNIVCDPDIPDYVVTDLIDVRAHLTIMPGVVIAFEANAGMDITDVNADGSLTAEGTGSDKIIFTGTEEEAGFWRGLSFESNDSRNVLREVNVRYAGSDPIVTYGTGVALHGAVAIESESGFNGSLSIERTTISNTSGYGLIVEEGTLLREFGANSFVNNTESAVRIDANNVGAIDAFSDFFGGIPELNGTNGFNGVEINASVSSIHDITEDAVWPALDRGAAYRVEQSFDVEAQLNIMPGAIIEFEANQTAIFKQNLDIPLGTLIAKGTESDPITFTGVLKTPGYWQGLIIQSNSILNEMDYCIIEYGGSDPIAGELANIGVEKDGAYDSPSLKVTNSIIRYSAGCGIVFEAGNLNYDGSTFSDNVGLDVCL
ncbi:hypothetical protein [Fulvivirga sp.]|uniref:hypothetical protein n=1 Tax=Fulvivirga sp. TaxID=1931237 RepID=UPI0032EDBCBC